MRMHKIIEQITSEDVEVLEQSLAFVRERSARENERGKAAEARATAMLAILGILAGFIVPLVDGISTVSGEIKWSLIAALFGSLIFLLKGLYHAVGVLGVARQHRLAVESVFEFQGRSRADALREEIAGLVWECQKAVQPNTVKFFGLHRCQRSGLIAIILFMLFGILLLVAHEQWFVVPQSAAYGISVITLVALFTVDVVAEKNSIWRQERRSGTTVGSEIS